MRYTSFISRLGQQQIKKPPGFGTSPLIPSQQQTAETASTYSKS
jgi:hypothetical protein